MAPKFNLRQLRRRSLASFRTTRSTDTSSNDEPSSSSQELSSVGSITPPSLADESDPALHPQVPATTRPPPESNSNRFSVAESVASEPRSTKDVQDQLQYHQPLSQYAPRVSNIRDKSTVGHRLSISILLRIVSCPELLHLPCLHLAFLVLPLDHQMRSRSTASAYSQIGLSKGFACDWRHWTGSSSPDRWYPTCVPSRQGLSTHQMASLRRTIQGSHLPFPGTEYSMFRVSEARISKPPSFKHPSLYV